MKISLDELRALSQQRFFVTFKESIDGLGAVKPVLAELVISANPAGMTVTGTIRTLLKLICHRCLRPFFLNLNIPVEERLLEYSQIQENGNCRKEGELTAEDFVEQLLPNNTLDIKDMIYQAIVLATPTSVLCGDNCPGPEMPKVADHPGLLNTNKDNVPGDQTMDKIDPRWQNLKTLFPKREPEEK